MNYCLDQPLPMGSESVGEPSGGVSEDRTAARDLRWLVKLCREASFPREGMSMGKILAEMDRRGELSERERRHILRVVEYLPYVEFSAER